MLEPIVLVVPFDPHRTSPNQSIQWRTLAGRKKTFRRATVAAWRMAGSPQVNPNGKVRISFIGRRVRRLDNDNLIASCKACLDQVVACIGLKDDSPDHVVIGDVRQETGARWKLQPHVELWIEVL